ncbi:MAG: amino acid permease [Nitrospinae bacterium]|nr:amino acid permease [Nitrospinota bacterium]
MEKFLRRKDYSSQLGKFEQKLGVWDVTAIGIGGTIGAGIFVLTGKAASHTGSGVILSFILCGIAVGITALVYAELSSAYPISGSAYSYTYLSLGEGFAWLVGWELLLEYGMATAAVSTGWSSHLRQFLGEHFHFFLPVALTGFFNPAEGTYLDLFAMLSVIAVFAFLTIGIKESSAVNSVIVVIKLAVLGLFIFIGVKYVRYDNFKPFLPAGWTGVWESASLIFFAYLGFDAASTVAEETKDPKRTVPLGLMFSLGISTLLYVTVAVVLCGTVPYQQIDQKAALASAMYRSGEPFAGGVIDIGAVFTITSVMMVMGIGYTRVVYALARDGLLFKALGDIHPKFKTPYKASILGGAFLCVLAGLVPLGVLAELINIGTLFAYFMVGIAVIVIRKTHKANPRFTVPFAKVLLPLNLILIVFIMAGLPGATWLRFGLWSLLGLTIYMLYGRKQSAMNAQS